MIFILQKMAENCKHFEIFWSQKFPHVRYFGIRAVLISIYFYTSDFLGVQLYLQAKLDTWKNGSTKPKGTSDQKQPKASLFFFVKPTTTCDVILNYSSVDPYSHVTWKLKSHVELFSRKKTDLDEVQKWICGSAFWRFL